MVTKFTDDVNIVQSLSDLPNASDGLTAAALKAKFDQAAGLIKAYLNDSLTAEIDAALADIDGTLTAHVHDDRYFTEAELSAISGAALVGASVTGLTGSTIQAVLESIKSALGALEAQLPNGQDIPYTNTRIDAIEATLEADQTQTATIVRGLQIIATDQDTPMWMKQIIGRHVVNHVPLFDSGLWTLHANVTVDSPSKVTLVADANFQSSTLASIPVKQGQSYTFSVTVSGTGSKRAYILEKDSVGTGIVSQNAVLGTEEGEFSVTFTPNASTVAVDVILQNTTSLGTYTFENIMLNEGSTAEGFVANLKPLQGAYVTRYGENLLPPFSQWAVLHANATVQSAYELDVVADGTAIVNYCKIPAIPNETYTLSGSKSPYLNAYYDVLGYDENGVQVFDSSNLTDSSPITFTLPSNVVEMRVRVVLEPALTSGTYTFTNPMLNLGSTALPFVPQNNATLYITRPLYGNGTVNDVVNEADGKLWLTKWWEYVLLDGSLPWEFGSDYTGYKYVRVPTSELPNILRANDETEPHVPVKYNGKILKNEIVFSTGGADLYNIDTISDYFALTIADADTGWAEIYVPTQADIQAYFDANPYQLVYQLSTPETIELQEGVDYFGSVSLIEGDNLVELGEAVVVKEPVNLKDTGSGLLFGVASVEGTAFYDGYKTGHRVDKFLQIFKGNEAVPFSVATGAGGFLICTIDSQYFDPTAQYYTTYIAKSYQLSAHADSVDAEYATNLRTVVAHNVQDIADVREDISDIAGDIERRLLKGEGENVQRGDASATGVITFERAFTSAPTVICVTKSATVAYPTSVTATGFTLNGAAAYWVAIGE